MTDKERYEEAKRKAKKRSKDLFKPDPDDVKEELEDETTLGSPENLVDRSDEEE
ncbi:hypothetical protein [uncultured Microbulbifer sp.]|uniref:hypothetical protein n=1 Tax=uncultured Microbulbifer sp. TaxID=348147 RepID=UPI0026330D78|nr:hypothetical protein [uncultured Microbulbifer sp.]